MNKKITTISDLTYYLVGGAVRDSLLKRKVVEKDYLVVGANVQDMLNLGFTPVGKDFPVFLHPQTKDEYALARTEKKQGSGYTGFVCYTSPDVTIEEDLLRRDLTVNAMAMDESGNIIDPYHGQNDLKNKLLRHVSPAFSEDPLRVLRVARFAARYHEYGFSVADETLCLMRDISQSGELTQLTAERLWKEMQRSLTEANPEVFFTVLRDCGALKVLWPSLDALWGIPNPATWHPEICSGLHTMMTLQRAVQLKASTRVRFAAVSHDLGKTLTSSDKWPSHQGHEKAGLPLIEDICAQLKVPTDYKVLALKVCEFHLHCHKAFELKASTILKLFERLDVWRKPDEFNDFLLACQADAQGRKGMNDAPYPQVDYLKSLYAQALKITAQPFVKQGLKGIQIKDAIYKARLDLIKTLITNHKVS